ncbi:hypothetical protein MY11210_001981 [Beauveria gryllotalpidicola]
MCVIIKLVHLCGHPNGNYIWKPQNAVDCPLSSGATRCERPTVRTQMVHSYCSASRLVGFARCRRKAFREAGWLCHVCDSLNVPEEGANCNFAFSCAVCKTKDSPRSLLAGEYPQARHIASRIEAVMTCRDSSLRAVSPKPVCTVIRNFVANPDRQVPRPAWICRQDPSGRPSNGNNQAA